MMTDVNANIQHRRAPRSISHDVLRRSRGFTSATSALRNTMPPPMQSDYSTNTGGGGPGFNASVASTLAGIQTLLAQQ